VTLLMTLTSGLLWLTAGKTRRDLSGSAYLQSLDPDRAPQAVPRDASRWGEMTAHEVAGRLVRRWQPEAHVAGRELIYFPGGGFVNPLATAHWWIIRRLMTHARAAVTIADYPLTPEHTYDQARAFVDAVYAHVADDPRTTALFVAGDSAGGNVALSLALRVRDERRRPIDGLILLAPWVDPTMRNPDAARLQRRDPSLRCDGLRAAGVAWAGSLPTDDPQISPLFDTLADLPPTLLFQGGRDIFLADAQLFAAKADRAGSPVRLIVAPDGFHVYPGAYWTREAREAFDLVARFSDDPVGVSRREILAMADSDARWAAVREVEIALLSSEIRGDRDAASRLLHPDFTEIGRSGRHWTRAEILDALAAEAPRDTPMPDQWRFVDIAPSTVLVTYRLHSATTVSRHSSLWTLTAEGPRMLFHQGTIVPEG
jgi:acetyl esterase/lipase